MLNLLSNAFKFTAKGGVTLEVSEVTSGWSANHPVLKDGEAALAIAVTDTGIGIPEEKQKLIFEAFQQADGTTSRKYGGTGLGLSISREIARLLGGELQVQSQPGVGSSFTLYVPLKAAHAVPAIGQPRQPRELNGGAEVGAAALATRIEISDDRDSLAGEKFVLIIEDDVAFASILLDVARDAGLKAVVSNAGSGTLALARKLRPDAITLDLGLADIDGWVLLDLLKHDPDTRHLPIHVISGGSQIASVIELGAFGVTEKPASREELAEVFSKLGAVIHRATDTTLVLSGSKKQRKAVMDALDGCVARVESAESISHAASSFELGEFAHILLLASTARVAIAQAAALLASGLRSDVCVTVMGADTALARSICENLSEKFDTGVAENMQDLKNRLWLAGTDDAGSMPPAAADHNNFDLSGAHILIVDDDIRNIYSLTSVLEELRGQCRACRTGARWHYYS